MQCAGGLLAYLYETQKTDLSHIADLTCYTAGQFMELDLTARQTLELTRHHAGQGEEGLPAVGAGQDTTPPWGGG